MQREHIYCAGTTAAIRHAETILRNSGFSIVTAPGWSVSHLLLDVPSFRNTQTLRSGANADTLLNSLPKDIVIWGGNLNDRITGNYQTVDFLKDETYLVQNAVITAECILPIAEPLLEGAWQDSPALVIGWGRIGKHLSRLLRSLGSDVTVASGNPKSRSELTALGFHSIPTPAIHTDADHYRIVFNTAPAPVIREEDAGRWKNCIKIDLASQRGIAGDDVIWARGLPGIHAPERSGRLIAETFSRLWKEMEK